jgi:hypothetical protein
MALDWRKLSAATLPDEEGPLDWGSLTDPSRKRRDKGPGFLRSAADIGVKTIAGVPQALAGITGLGTMVPGVRELADPATAGLTQASRAIEESLLSDYQLRKQREMAQRMQEEEGFLDQAGAMAKYLYENPRQIATTAAASLPSMLTGGLIGRGLQLTTRGTGMAMSPATAAALGEGTVIAGGVAGDIAAQSPELSDRLYGIPAGIGGATVSRLSGRLMGRSDIDTMLSARLARQDLADAAIPEGAIASRLAQGSATDILAPAGTTTGRISRGIIGEGLLEEAPQSAMERMATNVGTGRPMMENVGGDVVLGAASGGLMGAGAGVRRPGGTYTPEESREALRIMADRESPLEQKAIAANFVRGIEIGRLGEKAATTRFNDYINSLVAEQERVDPTPKDLLSGLQQVETRRGLVTEQPLEEAELGRAMPRLVPTGIPGVLLNQATGNYEIETQPEPLQRVTTQRPVQNIPGVTVDESGVYRLAEPRIPSALVAPSGGTPATVSPSAPVAPGSFSTTPAAPKAAAPKKTTKPKAAVAPTSTISLGEELDLDTEDDQKTLQSIIGQIKNTKVESKPLEASVQGSKFAVPGRPSLAQRAYQGIRDALLRPPKKAGETPKVSKLYGKNEQTIVDALYGFLAAYNAYTSGQAISTSEATRLAKKVPVGSTEAQMAELSVAEAGRRVDKSAASAESVRQALAKVGEVLQGNAKDVEVVVRLIKDTVQKQLVKAGEDWKKTIPAQIAKAEKSKDTKTANELKKVLQKLKRYEQIDIRLSAAWNAAKQENFLNELADISGVSSEPLRVSEEAKEADQKGLSPLEAATKNGYGNMTGTAKKEKGIIGLLNYLRFHGTPYSKTLAFAVRNALEVQENLPKVRFITEGKSRYDPNTDTIYINKESSPEVALHEAMHSALQWFVHSNPNSEYVKQLEKSLDTVLNFKGQLSPKAEEVRAVLRKLVGEKRKLDAVLELVSYTATMNEFRRALQAMPSQGVPKTFYEAAQNIWRMTIALMGRFLGVKPNVASDVLVTSMKLLERSTVKATKPAKLTGKPLEAAVVSNTTESPMPNQVSNVDFRAFANSQESWRLPTQVAGELLGFGKNGTTTNYIKERGAKLAQKIRKDYPKLETFILNFNSKFSNGIAVNTLGDTFKYDQNTGYMQAEKIAEYLDSHPDIAKPFLAYMDGNKNALNKVDDNDKLKDQADYLMRMYEKYINSLPETSSERAFFEGKKFSEYLIVPRKVSQAAGTTFGVKALSSMLGIKPIVERNIDFFKPWLNEVDGVLETDNLYEVMESMDGELVHAGFMAKDKFDKNGTPPGFTVSTDMTWRMSQLNDGAYRFTARMTAAQAAERRDISKVTTALLNTTAALAHTYASRNFLDGVATVGYEDGKPTAQSVAFESIKEINSVFDGRKITEDDVVEASDEVIKSPRIRTLLQRTGTWVKIPDSPTYGALVGKYIPGPVWNYMVDMHDRSPLINSRIFNETMGWFKEAKTVLNPGTHVTNFLTNITLSYLHNIPTTTTARAARLFALYEIAPKKLTREEMQLMQEFNASGAILGEYTSAEVKKTIYDALEQAIKPDSDSSVLTKLNAFSKYEKIKAGLQKLRDKSKEVYAAEDNIFRLAAFLNTAGNIQYRDKSSALSEEQIKEAGQAAKEMFLDYDIDARAVRAARQSVLPFVSWTYAIMPVLGRIAIEKPWAIANVMLAYMLVQAAMGGGEDDDEELRKAGPKYIREKAFGVGPYMFLRLPFMGDEENPVYFNLGKYVPFFTIFQPPPGQGMLAGQSWIPGFLTPSGPIVSLVSAMTGYDPFTGKPLHQPTDDEWDKLTNFGKAVYDTVAPPALNSQFVKDLNNLSEGKTTITGREPDTLFIARKLGGLSLYEFNIDESLIKQQKAVKAIEKDFKAAMRKAKQDEYRKGYPDYEALDEKLEVLRERMDKRIAEVRGGEEEE